jgi:hypothetical protein
MTFSIKGGKASPITRNIIKQIADVIIPFFNFFIFGLNFPDALRASSATS